ncbi:tetratricopeptide repeat protein [Methanomethylovorans sp.]|uniref:tetratricopeptide repeat protein n=1 Tax=Methanomethylovorans sp. TaxID=2758717 RepID=UPI000B0A2915|nr:tetratricopeptide repeat protein [Methanomethylovorans sp.]
MDEQSVDDYWFKKGFFSEDPEEKISCYDRILESYPEVSSLWNHELFSLIWSNKGIAYSYLGMHDKALECFDKALQYNELDMDAWCNKGISLFNLGRYDEAVFCYDKVLEKDMSNENALFNKGVSLAHIGKYEEAIDCYSKLHRELEIDSKFAVIWYKKGMAYSSLGQMDEAINCFLRALEIDPEHGGAIEGLKRCTRKKKEDLTGD